MTRDQVLEAATRLVGAQGSVRDYPCDCPPGGERFLVKWEQERIPSCYSLEELEEEIASGAIVDTGELGDLGWWEGRGGERAREWLARTRLR